MEQSRATSAQLWLPLVTGLPQAGAAAQVLQACFIKLQLLS